jgi:hypothetical protein
MGRPKGSKNDKADSLEAFAKRIESHIIKSKLKDCENMERLICRILTNEKMPAVTSALAQKWVEWRYGKAVQPIAGKDGGPIQVQLITNATFPSE